MNNKLILVGGGGHCVSVMDSIDRKIYDDIQIVDSAYKAGTDINGITVYGDDTALSELYAKGYRNAFITVGSVGDYKNRSRIAEMLTAYHFHFVNIIDSSAVISKHAKLGKGIFVGKHAVINADAQIADFCIINTGAVVEHGCMVEQYVHIAPGAVVLGNCRIKEQTHIGANSTVLQNITVGKRVMIGMGSIVLHDVADNQKRYGKI